MLMAHRERKILWERTQLPFGSLGFPGKGHPGVCMCVCVWQGRGWWLEMNKATGPTDRKGPSRSQRQSREGHTLSQSRPGPMLLRLATGDHRTQLSGQPRASEFHPVELGSRTLASGPLFLDCSVHRQREMHRLDAGGSPLLMSGTWSPSTAQRSDAAVGRTEPGPRLCVQQAAPDCMCAVCWGAARVEHLTRGSLSCW